MSHGQLQFESTGEPCRLVREIGRGGQKTVYECQVQGHVVGVLHNPEPDYGDRTFKLMAWPVSVVAQKLHAFPIDRLRNAQGQIVGIVMPQRDGSKFTELLSGLTRPGWLDDQLLLEIFAELALAVNAANASGYLIGDLNPENAVFTGDGKVSMLDSDSYFHRAGDQVFPTTVGVADYLPPELQKKHRAGRLAEAQRTLGGDSFAFATILFTAVMEGNHPFANQDAISVTDLIEAGKWPHSGTGVTQPRRCCPRLEDIPAELAELFRKTFDLGLMDPNLRPSMNDWYCCLKQLSQSAGGAAYEPPMPPPVRKYQSHSPGATTGNPPPAKPKAAQVRPGNTCTAPAPTVAIHKKNSLDMPLPLAILLCIVSLAVPGWAAVTYWHPFLLDKVRVKELKDAPRIWNELIGVGADVSDSKGIEE